MSNDTQPPVGTNTPAVPPGATVPIQIGKPVGVTKYDEGRGPDAPLGVIGTIHSDSKVKMEAQAYQTGAIQERVELQYKAMGGNWVEVLSTAVQTNGNSDAGPRTLGAPFDLQCHGTYYDSSTGGAGHQVPDEKWKLEATEHQHGWLVRVGFWDRDPRFDRPIDEARVLVTLTIET